jgi:hypothetical protein
LVRQIGVDLADDVALETADDLAFAETFGGSSLHVVTGGLMVAYADDGDDVESAVSGPVAAAAEAVTAVGAAAAGGQPFKFVNTPSHKPQVFQAPTLSEPDTATLAHWQPVARGLRILAFALRSYESIDDPWSTAPCQLVLGAIAVGASSFLTAISDAAALDAYQNAIRAADAWLVQGNCVQSVPPLSDVEPS